MRSPALLLLLRALGLAAAGLCVGCSTRTNPSFALSHHEARVALEEMARDPKPLERPLVVLGGWIDPGLTEAVLRHRLGQRIENDQLILGQSFAWVGDFDACRARLIERVDQQFPSDDPIWTREVDVVAVSMGGLIARYAAAPGPASDSRRLHIRRLFTLSTPHQGAQLARFAFWNQKAVQMQAGSPLLRQLDQAERPYELICYVRLDDHIVGSANAAPAGHELWWCDNPPLALAHVGICADRRVLADICRRLRDEPPFTHSPASPLPDTDGSGNED